MGDSLLSAHPAHDAKELERERERRKRDKKKLKRALEKVGRVLICFITRSRHAFTS